MVFFAPHPHNKEAQVQYYQTQYGLAGFPPLDVGFYFDLTAKSVTAIKNMKAAGAWKELSYGKCSIHNNKLQVEREQDLVKHFQV